jgi:SAM-dependent methyltransferase
MRRTLVIVLAMTLFGGAWAELFSGQADADRDKPKLDVPYEPTSYAIAEAMLSIADVNPKDVVYDLGCGDGRIVIKAVKERGARGVGVDVDPARIKESRENAKAAGVTDRITFVQQNLFDTDISDATVVMLYLWPEVNLRLRPRLLRELKPGTRIVSHSHTMGDWEADAVRTVERHKIHFFVIPANVSGTWSWKEADGSRIELLLSQKFQKVKGSIRTGAGDAPITGSLLRGDTLRFSAERTIKGKKELRTFEGRVSGHTFTGKITGGGAAKAIDWKATRDESTERTIAE